MSQATFRGFRVRRLMFGYTHGEGKLNEKQSVHALRRNLKQKEAGGAARTPAHKGLLGMLLRELAARREAAGDPWPSTKSSYHELSREASRMKKLLGAYSDTPRNQLDDVKPLFLAFHAIQARLKQMQGETDARAQAVVHRAEAEKKLGRIDELLLEASELKAVSPCLVDLFTNDLELSHKCDRSWKSMKKRLWQSLIERWRRKQKLHRLPSSTRSLIISRR